MIDITVQKQLREQLENLPAVQQHQVLEFARSLVKAKGRGVPGKDLLRFAGAIEAVIFPFHTHYASLLRLFRIISVPLIFKI